MTIRKIIRTSQPQTTCGIDWSNPITRGLVEAQTPTFSFPSATETNAVGLAVAQAGKAFVFNGSSSFQTTAYGSFGNSITLGFIGIVTNISSYPALMARVAGDLSGFWINQNGGLHLRQTNATPGLDGQSGGIVNGALFHANGVFSSSSGRSVYLNGKISASDSNTSASGNLAAPLYVGRTGQGGNENFFAGQYFLRYRYNRALSPAEIKSLSDNPWQVFQPLSQPIYTSNQDIILPSKGYPTKDLSKGLWTGFSENNINSTLSDKIDEDTPDTSDYIYTDYPTTSEYELSETQFPGAGGYQLSYNASGASGAVITVKLRQGMTEIAQWQHPLTVADTTYTQTLTPEQVALIVAGPVIVNLDVN